MDISPLAPENPLPEMPRVPGVRLSACAANIRYRDRPDLMLADVVPGTRVAGTFTKSLTAAAPVDWCRKSVTEGGGQARVLIINSGNANAFTGLEGVASVGRVVGRAADVFSCKTREVYVASTGVIGERLDDTRITDHLAGLKGALSKDGWADAAHAIMTTDTFPKLATATADIDGQSVTINGFAKGSGMIAPDMATMLAFVFTDADLSADVLQSLLTKKVRRTFNCITVDGDTSTSDTVLAFATGRAAHDRITTVDDPALSDFSEKLYSVLLSLAQMIVKDGEGASKFIEIRVSGAENDEAARKIGLSIGNSPLVKTAVAGEDANWGRIVMAVGKAGQRADRDRLSISIGGVSVAKNGKAVPGYDETPVAAHMKGENILIEVDVGIGDGLARVWTCDLTHRYIDINADYRT